MSVWNAYFTGLCEPNPGGVMAWGFVIDADGDLVTKAAVRSTCEANTNNVAAYYAFGLLVREVVDLLSASEAKRKRFAGLHVRGDSKLVVEQINGQWQVKAEALAPLHRRCLELLKDTGQPWVLEWIEHGLNTAAVRAAAGAYRQHTGKDLPQRPWRAA